MYTYDNSQVTAVNTGMATAYLIFYIVIAVLMVIANWKIFTKAGRAGWKSIIPFYNFYTEFEIAGLNGWMFLIMFIPFVGVLVAEILLGINLAKAFGKGTGFAVGLILLNPIFRLILAFGSAEYQGTQPAIQQ